MNLLLIKCCKPWTQLQCLSVLNNEIINITMFLEFIEQNPRITNLEFEACDAEIQLQGIANHLPMLQKLTMHSVDSTFGEWNLVHIGRLQHLSEIDLLTLDYQHL